MSRWIDNANPRPANRWRTIVWGGAAALLLLPAVAMQFTSEVTWEGFDFAVFGTMLLLACGTYELGTRMSRNRHYRAAIAIAVVSGFLLVWINLAVGILGNESNPANLMYAGVLAVGVLGALIARFRAPGMSRAMQATAVAQIAVAVIALVAGYGATVLLTAVFVGLWLLSAALFNKAARSS